MDFKLKKSELNFRVYTATEPPETGNENDICVISSVPMKNWILSPDAPNGKPRTDGDVCIQYSTTGNVVNVLKNNSMFLNFGRTFQYVDGAWKDVSAMCYSGGEWVDLAEIVFNRETQEFSVITANLHIVNNASVSPVTDADPFVQMSSASNSATARAWQWETPVDFSNYSTLIVTGYATGGKFGIASSLATDVEKVATVKSMPFENAENAHILDISDVSGVGYIGFYANAQRTVYVKSVMLI